MTWVLKYGLAWDGLIGISSSSAIPLTMGMQKRKAKVDTNSVIREGHVNQVNNDDLVDISRCSNLKDVFQATINFGSRPTEKIC